MARRDPEQSEFLQAVEEVLMSLEPVLQAKPQYGTVLERMCEPERLIMFRSVGSCQGRGHVRAHASRYQAL